MNNPIEVIFLRHFEGAEDPRDNRGKEYILLPTFRSYFTEKIFRKQILIQ